MHFLPKTPLRLLLYGVLLLFLQQTASAQITIDSVVYDPCFNGSPGSIPVTIFASGGSGAQYQVSTDNGVTYGAFGTYTFNLATGNSYDIIAADNLGTLSDTVQISIPANALSSNISLQLNYNGQALSCFKASDGTAEAQVTGGAGPYTYNWNTFPTQSTAIATGLGAGVYDVTVTDDNGCNSVSSVTVAEPGSINITANATDASCNGFSDGSATATAVGGTGSLSYIWSTSPNQNTATATGLAPGSYSVTATDANGCVKIEFVTVTEPSAISLSSASIATNCNAASDGSATVTPTGGSSPFTYNWDSAPSQTTATATGLAAGNYNVTVTDNSGCTVSESVTVTEPTAVSVTANLSSAISCGGASDGEATASGSGGDAGPYSYQWSTSPTQNTAIATGLSVGSYTVTATDGNACEATTTIILTEPSAVSVTTLVSSNYNGQDISCNGASDGEATATPSGGDGGPYSYQWSSNPTQITAIATGLAAGTYDVTVTDGNGCSVTDNITLNEPTDLVVTASVTSDYNGQDISCNGASDGDLLATAFGGTGSLNYQWSTAPIQTTAAATGLAAGTYTVTVSDANGCQTTADVTLTEPSEITLTTAVTSNYNGQDISCNAASDGEATGTTSGGTTGYSYQWSTAPMQTTAIATGLSAGTYSLTTTDLNGCQEIESITLTEPSAVSVTTLVSSDYNGQDVSCNGASDGVAVATGAGGTTTYTYQWSTAPIQLSDTATALIAGVYTVTMTDVNGCSTTENITLTEPSAVSISAAVTSNYNGQNISCNGAADGEATGTATGGTAGYSYQWSTVPTQNTAIATGLVAGVYTVTTTDINGCEETTSITLTEPSAVSVTAVVSSDYNGADISCNGAADGEATGTASGGTAGYSYQWSTSPTQNTAIATGLAAGTYTVTTTDLNGCLETTNVTVTEPFEITANTTITSDYNGSQISCNGASDGEATTIAAGGTGSLNYQWNTSPIQTTSIATGLPARIYIVSITDNNGCMLMDTVDLTEPDVVNAQAVATSNYNGVNISCLGGNDGSATVNTTGGTGAYSYNWNTSPVQTTISATALEANTYQVTVTDLNGCSDTSLVILIEPANAVSGTITPSDFNGFGVSCNGSNDGSALAQISTGFAPYTYQWSNGSNTANTTALNAGTYVVTMTDDNGCIYVDSTIITEPPVLSVNASISSTYNGGYNISCFNATDGAAAATASGGIPGYTYQWSNGANTQNITGIAAGVYTVTATDLNACETTSSITLTEPGELLSTISQIADVSCNGNADASLTASISGGTANYNYNWSTTATTDSINNLAAGTYDLTITDANNCTVSDQITITEPAVLSATSSNTDDFCNNTNGSISITATGGTTAYNYQWSNGENGSTISQLSSGFYAYTLTDANGCIFTGTDSVLATSYPISIFANVEDSDCYAANSGSIEANSTGAFYPLNYQWSNGATDSSLTNLANGTYLVTLTDVNGCTAIDSFNIENLESPISIDLESPLYPNGFNTTRTDEEDGSIDATITGGVEAFTYNWSNGATTEDLENIAAATYIITVTDINGCVASDSIILTEPEPEAPEMPEGISPDGDGLNDVFFIKNIEFYPDNLLLIYNRWGDEVQRFEGYNNQWNGDNKSGRPLPAGTYYVILQLTDRDEHYKGIVEIRRR